MKTCFASTLLVLSAAVHAAPPQQRVDAPRQATRHIQFNQRDLSEQELRVIEQLEAAYRFRLPEIGRAHV